MKRTKCLGCKTGYISSQSKTNPYTSEGYSKKCYEEKFGKPKLKKLIENKTNCPQCMKEFVLTRKRIKFCSRKCQKAYNANVNASKAGKSSAQKQQRRSKNEVAFADLCIEKFGSKNVKLNEPMFDGWDADVILINHKIAILWDGKVHREKIFPGQSLVQIKTRDKIKRKKIEECGYEWYKVVDNGKYDLNFVKNKFDEFVKKFEL